MDIQHTISVPTKQAEDNGGGGLNKLLRLSRGSNSGGGEALRRHSSSSNNSFDLAGSLFSSMQNLESSGRSLSSLLHPSSVPLLMTPGAQLNLSGRVGFPVGGQDPRMGVGTGQNLRLPPSNLMHLFPSQQMGGSLPHSNPFQAAPNLDAIRGGYFPSSKVQGLDDSSTVTDITNMNDFTTQELINELTRRRSERNRASAVLDATSALLSAEHLSKARLMNGGRAQDPRDSRTRRGSDDSLDLLAATANFSAVKERVVEEKQKTNPTQNSGADTAAVRTIPTCFTPASKTAMKRKKDKNVQSESSDASEDEATGIERKKAKRNPSTNSLDVLLTALGDDLEQLDNTNTEKAKVPSGFRTEKEDELLRRFSKESLISNISDEDLICRPVTNIQDNSPRKRKQSNLAPLLDTRSSFTMPSKESDAILYPAHGLSPDYARRLQASHTMMASLESEMIRNDIAIREFAFREMQRRQLTSRMMQNSLGSNKAPSLPAHPKVLQNGLQSNKAPQLPAYAKAEQELQLPAKLPTSGSRNVSLSDTPVSDCEKSKEAKEEKNKPKQSPHLPNRHQTSITSVDYNRSPLPWHRKSEKPIKIPPKQALQMFLSAHGKKGETLREAVLKAISETESSLATIHAWDRSKGLRKCHSRTVVKTRRSRAHLKAFLMGVEPPKEPHQNRKRPKKSKHKKMDDVFGPPRDRW